MKQIRCGVRDCTWAMPVRDWLGIRFAVVLFALWHEHLVDAHGLEPDVNKPPVLESAQLYFDHVDGTTAVLTIHAKDRRCPLAPVMLAEGEVDGECGHPCPPSQACNQCAEYWDKMRREGLWDDKKGWTAKGWNSIIR